MKLDKRERIQRELRIYPRWRAKDTPAKPKTNPTPRAAAHNETNNKLSNAPREVAITPAAPAPATIPATATMPATAAMHATASMNWQQLTQTATNCTHCPLHEKRTQVVFGSGAQTASVMVVGEGPGKEEDRQGEPFVGRAGQLLTNMLRAIDLERTQVYITNAVKCRPPNNRTPESSEIAACAGYLKRQIELVNPDVILALGKTAVIALLATDESIAKLRQHLHTNRDGIRVVVTYHPAYLLRYPKDKRKVYHDLLFLRRILNE